MTVYSLRELEGRLMRVEQRFEAPYYPDGPANSHAEKVPRTYYVPSPEGAFADAHLLFFLCPKCFEANHGRIGTHQVLVGFAARNVPAGTASVGKDGQDTRWIVSGTSLDDLVLTPSIQLHGGCNWHGFVGSNGIPPGHAG